MQAVFPKELQDPTHSKAYRKACLVAQKKCLYTDVYPQQLRSEVSPVVAWLHDSQRQPQFSESQENLRWAVETQETFVVFSSWCCNRNMICKSCLLVSKCQKGNNISFFKKNEWTEAGASRRKWDSEICCCYLLTTVKMIKGWAVFWYLTVGINKHLIIEKGGKSTCPN